MIVRDATGAQVAMFDSWDRLYYHPRVNGISDFQLKIKGDDTRISLFALDGRAEVWRKDSDASIVWYCDKEFLIRSFRREMDANGRKFFSAGGVGLLHFLTRRLCIPSSGEVTNISAVAADTAIYNLVDANCGSGAAAARQITGLSLVAASGVASSVSRDVRRNEYLFSVCQELASAARGAGTGVDFDIYGIGKDSTLGIAAFKFKTYSPYLGSSKIAGAAGAVIFSLGFDNIISPAYSDDRTAEVNYVYAGGAGEGVSKLIQETSGIGTADSTWNRLEAWVDAQDQFDTASLTSISRAYMRNSGRQRTLDFTALDSQGYRYGRDWFVGDYVTARYDDQEVNAQVIGAVITVTANGESLLPELSTV